MTLPALRLRPEACKALAYVSSSAPRAQAMQRRRKASTSASYPASCASFNTELDAQEPSSSTPSSKQTQSDFSHFFDRQISSDSPWYRPEYEIFSHSKDSVAAFKDAVKRKDVNGLSSRYESLLEAFNTHKTVWEDSTSRPFKLNHSFPLRKNDLQSAIRLIIKHGKTRGRLDERLLATCQLLFDDMSSVFGFSYGPTDLHYNLQAHCLQDPTSAVFRDPVDHFADLRAKHPEWKTSSVDWNLVMTVLARTQQYDRALQLWHDMAQHGTQPEIQIQNTIAALHLSFGNVGEAETVMASISQDLQSAGEKPRIDTLTIAVEGYLNFLEANPKDEAFVTSRLRSYAQKLHQALVSCSNDKVDLAGWHALLRYEAIMLGPSHALETAKEANRPSMFNSRTVCVLLRLHTEDLQHLKTSDDALDLLDRILAIDPSGKLKADSESYYILISALLGRLPRRKATESARQDRSWAAFSPSSGMNLESSPSFAVLPTPNQIREAQTLYDQIRSDGVRPVPQLVAPLLSAYCEAFLPSLSSAMKLVQDLLDNQKTAWRAPAGSPNANNSSEETSSVIGMNIIGTVLNACVRLRDLSVAKDLIARMQKAGLTIEAWHKVHIARLLMSMASSWLDAFRIYQSVSRLPLDKHGRRSGFDERGYAALLDSFRKLPFSVDARGKAKEPAPPEYLLTILEDMRAAGFQPSCAVYTSILDYYSKTPQPSYEGVKATHNILKQDQYLVPDLPLINALMNAYNRADEPALVLAIWDSLMATKQEIDGITLSILFDAAGRHGLLSVARKAITTVRRLEALRSEFGYDEDLDCSATASVASPASVGTAAWLGLRRPKYRSSAMNKGAWDAYLECLARCGRLEESIELSFGDMRKSLIREAILSGDLITDLSVNDLVTQTRQAPVKDQYGKIVGPDSKTFGTLLKFAAKERDRRQKQRGSGSPKDSDTKATSSTIWHTLRQRIREEYSWIFPSVRDVGLEES